jgi:hypothetical protein
MNNSAWSFRWVPAFAVAAVSIAALGAAASASWRGARERVHAQRPAADAPVQVVRAPATPAARPRPTACSTCVMGASGRLL